MSVSRASHNCLTKMLETTEAQVLEADWYTLQEVQMNLARFRGGRVPRSTINRWISHLKIETNEFGFYTQSDITILARLAIWLKRGRTIESFKQLLIQELINAS